MGQTRGKIGFIRFVLVKICEIHARGNNEKRGKRREATE